MSFARECYKKSYDRPEVTDPQIQHGDGRPSPIQLLGVVPERGLSNPVVIITAVNRRRGHEETNIF